MYGRDSSRPTRFIAPHTEPTATASLTIACRPAPMGRYPDSHAGGENTMTQPGRRAHVVHAIPGRLRLRFVHHQAATPDDSLAALRSAPGVLAVEVRTAARSAVVQYDPARTTDAAILAALREAGVEIAAPARSPSPPGPAAETTDGVAAGAACKTGRTRASGCACQTSCAPRSGPLRTRQRVPGCITLAAPEANRRPVATSFSRVAAPVAPCNLKLLAGPPGERFSHNPRRIGTSSSATNFGGSISARSTFCHGSSSARIVPSAPRRAL